MPPSVTPASPAIEIVFHYLMLFYNDPRDGLRVLIPRKNHRAVLRDTATDAVIPLSQASIYLLIDGAAAPAAATTLDPAGRLVSLELPLKSTTTRAPDASFLDPANVPARLNALAQLPGGKIKAFPSEAFPDKADQVVKFELGPANVFCSQITDTTVYSRELPAGTTQAQLVIATPRRKYSIGIDVTRGARFELRNEDEKFGPLPDEQVYHADELRELLELLSPAAVGTIQCDTFSCGAFYCGDRQGVFTGAAGTPCP